CSLRPAWTLILSDDKQIGAVGKVAAATLLSLWSLGQRLGHGPLKGSIGSGGREKSSCGGLGRVTPGGFFAGFCCASFPALPFLRSCCFMSAGAEAKALAASAGTTLGLAATTASGLGWPVTGASGAAPA